MKNISVKKVIFWSLLLLIVIFATILRVYRLKEVAPGISWDEASVGYNAYTIAHWAKDEWGRFLPLTFKSFEDYKNPVHVYATVPFVGLLGLNELTTRLPAALFGVLNVLVMGLLAARLTKNKLIGILSAFILCVSPYNIQFSRFNHELNFAVFFFMLGLWLFYLGKDTGRKWLVAMSFGVLGFDLLTYHSAKLVTPLLVFLLIALNFRYLISIKRYFVVGILSYVFFVSLLLVDPNLLGLARAKQNKMDDSEIKKTYLYQKYQNTNLGFVNAVWSRYKMYYSNEFLFISGDPIPRHSAQVVGTFYKNAKYLLLLGLIYLLYEILVSRKKEYLLILAWGLLAPVPGAISSTFAHAARAMFMTGSWHLTVALGIYLLYVVFSKIKLGFLVIVLFVLAELVGLKTYVTYYYGEFATRYGTEWQYGMRDIGYYVLDNEDRFSRIYMTDAHSQPYIFFLFYLKTPLPEFLSTVTYNDTQSRPSNLVTGFLKYRFGMWDQIDSYPDPNILYIVNPSKYDGLKYKQQFDVVKHIVYPNKTDAFFLVNGYF